MGTRCAPFVQGILAYSNKDLIANGFIPETGTFRDQEVRVIPASRLAIEMQYSVRSDVSGTTLDDLAGGSVGGNVFGGLGGGAGFGIGSVIGQTQLGDFEPTTSQFIFHLAQAETRLNRSITVTESMLEEARDNDGVILYTVRDYIIGILGVVRTPIIFTDEEIENLGSSSSGSSRGWSVDNNGAIVADYEDFKASGEENLFVRRVVDSRKMDFRGDNYLFDDESNVFQNNGEDDLTDRVIEIKLTEALLATSTRETGDPLPEDPAEARVAPLIAGDRLYLTYSAATERIVRQAILAKSFFFLFPGGIVERIASDNVKVWNFKPYQFKVLKTHDIQSGRDPIRADLRDLATDEGVIANPDLTVDEIQRRLRLEDMESMRLTETLNETITKQPYIKGIYIADNRGIVAVTGYLVGDIRFETIVPRSQINDQEWFDALLATIDVFRPGYANGELFDLDFANTVLRGFVFDISDHVNSVCFDNEKYGYQRELATALKDVSAIDEDDSTKGIGFPNLDLITNRIPGRQAYDLSSAKFDAIRMSSIEGGSYFIRDCNKFFVDSTIQADMFIRTPFFFDSFGEDTRVYVERFTPQFALERDGGIWVFSSPAAFGQRMSVDEHPYNKFSYLVFNKDNSDGESTLRYFEFNDSSLKRQMHSTNNDPSDTSRTHEVPGVEDVVQSDVGSIGYDMVLGNQPGYSSGREISTDTGRIALGKSSADETYEKINLAFSQGQNSDSVTVSGLSSKKTKSIKIVYKISPEFLTTPSRLFSIIFPNEESVIDNISIPWAGPYRNTKEEIVVIDTRNYSDEVIRFSGEILKHVEIISIEATVFKDEAYEASKIISSISGTCFDESGNWLVFYEDERASDGDYGDQPESVDEGGQKEMSCLFSPDEGETWVDYKGIVQTVGTENIKVPYVISNKITNKIHLFFIINDVLMHKSIDPSLFVIEDAFKAYKRPISFNENTDPLSGINHFSDDGINMRQTALSVIIGNISEPYLTEQIEISKSRSEKGLFPRIILKGDLRDFEGGFASQDYFAFQNNKGGLVVVYSINGSVRVRVSNDEGETWEEVYVEEDDVLIHKNSIVQEAREVSQLGGTYDSQTGNLNLAYIVDDMIFAKTFNETLFSKDNTSLRSDLDAETTTHPPIFIVGNIPDELRASISGVDIDSPVVFPYPESAIDSFDDNMSISDNLPPVGYISSSGIVRMFYKDSFGNIRGLSFNPYQVQLDTKRRE